MTQENKELLNYYADLKIEEKQISEKVEEIKEKVIALMVESELEELELSDKGKLTLNKKRSWKYPEPIKQKEDEVKALKKEAEQLGTADYTENAYVVFKSFKE